MVIGKEKIKFPERAVKWLINPMIYGADNFGMKRIAFAMIFLLISVWIFAGEITLSYSGRGVYSLVERTNLRRYENGKYIGLTSREVRSCIAPADAYDDSRKEFAWFDGNFYVTQDTVRNKKTVNQGIHDSISSIFYIGSDGRMTMFEDNGFPSFRSFPAYTSSEIKIGESWKCQGERAVDPLNKGIYTRMPIIVQYTLTGEEVYKGQEVYRIKAMWQTNYGMSYKDYKGDGDLKKAVGGHKADIIVLKSSGQPFMILDTVDETFIYADGKQVNFKGTISMFTEFPAATDRDKLIPALTEIAGKSKGTKRKSKSLGGGSTGSITTVERASSVEEKVDEKVDETEVSKENQKSNGKDDSKNNKAGKGRKEESPNGDGAENKKEKDSISLNSGKTGNLTVDTFDGGVAVQMEAAKNDMLFEDTDSGLRLRIQNINFQPDSAEFVLGTEGSRFDDIARVLKLAPKSKFLIEGHTASVGKPAGEQLLSEQRARKIANELVNRGLPADSFICRGWGGKKPLMPNDTNAGRALNRRVEITILE